MFVIVICTIVEGLGNCSGINRAIKLSYRSINSSAYMLGKVVRSAAIVNDLNAKGIPLISSREEIPKYKKASILIPTYGISECIIKKIDRLGYRILDNTCPRVKFVQRIVSDASKKGWILY